MQVEIEKCSCCVVINSRKVILYHDICYYAREWKAHYKSVNFPPRKKLVNEKGDKDIFQWFFFIFSNLSGHCVIRNFILTTRSLSTSRFSARVLVTISSTCYSKLMEYMGILISKTYHRSLKRFLSIMTEGNLEKNVVRLIVNWSSYELCNMKIKYLRMEDWKRR